MEQLSPTRGYIHDELEELNDLSPEQQYVRKTIRGHLEYHNHDMFCEYCHCHIDDCDCED